MNLESWQTPAGGITHALSCLQCGYAIKPGRKFCSQCGSPVGATSDGRHTHSVRRLRVCPGCGFENHRSDRFCKACGGLLAGAPAETFTLEATKAGVAEERRPEAGAETPAGTPSDRNLDRAAWLGGLGETPAVSAEPTPEPLLDPTGEPVMQESPDSSDDRGAGRLRPRTLGLASLAVLLITGAALLYSYRVAARATLPVPMSLRNMAAMTSSSSLAAVALKASVAAEAVPRPSRAAPKAAAFARDAKVASGSPEPPRENAKATIAEVAPASSIGASSRMGALPGAGSTVPAQPATPSATAASGSANVSPAQSSNVRSDVDGSPAARERQSEVVGAVAAAENLVAAIPTASRPSPRRSLPAASNAPPAAVAAARPGAPPLPVGGSVQAGKVLSQPGPAYPAVARAAGIQGLVRLEAVITKDGTVRDLKVLSGNPMLAEAARDAVRRWRYQPAKLDGEPIEVRTDIDVDFKLP